MKKELKLVIITFLILCFSVASTTKTFAFENSYKFFCSPIALNDIDVNNPLGVWQYSVLGADSQYKEGTLFVRKENDIYIVEVQLSNGTLTGQDVSVKNNTIKFNLNIEGI